jgi:beta-glucosidase
MDDMAIRNVIGWYYIEADNGEFPSMAESGEYRPIPKEHRTLIRENGAKSMVLLKNVHNALPLRSPRRLSLFGAHAGKSISGPNEAFSVFGVSGPVYQGHLATASGAGSAPLPYLVTPHQALTERAAEDGTQFRWILNDTFLGGSTGLIGSGASTGVDPSLANYAQFSDVCLVFLNAWGGEGKDRSELSNPTQDRLVETVAENCNNTIVVINAVGPRIMDAWIESPNVTAVLYGAPLGQESGHSIVDVLYGNANPSAALTYTIAKNEDDYPARPCEDVDCEFTEGNYIDYKHFDRESIEPRFEFGFGLSYTSFEYSNLQIASEAKPGLSTGERGVGGRADLWEEVVRVTVDVANTGGTDGAHVVQLYLSFPEEADQPIRQLRGFEKIDLGKGQTDEVEMNLRRRDLSYWDVVAQEWRVAEGEYGVYVGASSRDFRAEGTFTVEE